MEQDYRCGGCVYKFGANQGVYEARQAAVLRMEMDGGEGVILRESFP
jgi:hypothetical protein